eukprot:1622065-Rhodomonas_salina.1
MEELKSDNAKELKEGPFAAFAVDEAILREFCPPHEHWANGGVERLIRTISEMIRCMLITAKLP